jgi:hypothetical protein
MAGTTDTVKAKLTPGEFVIRKEAVDMIGVPMLNKLNDMPEEGGHSAIDSLIQRATLANMKMMYGGGMVQPNYAGGGMVEEKMKGYQNGGSIYGMNRTPEGMMQAVYEMPTDDGNRYYLGESLRPQPSLSTQAARQKAMQRAVEMPEDSISFEMVQQILNPEAAEPEGKKGLMGLLGFQGGGSTLSYEKLAPFLGQSKRVHPDTGMPLYDVRQVVSVPAEEVGAGGGLRYYGSEETGDKIENAISEALRSSLETAIMSPQDSIPADMVKKFLKPRKKGIMGLLGFENGGPVNQMPEMLSQQAEALQSGMDQDTTNRARKALQYIKIQTLMNDPTLSKQSYTEFEGEAPSEVADIAKHFYSTVRDSANARALRGMQGHSSGYSPSIYGPR